MSPIWNNVWKDLVRFRLSFAAWTLLLVAKQLFFSAIAGVWGEPNFVLLGRLQEGMGVVLSWGIEPLVTFILVAGLIYEDPPAGKDPFWLTRPLSGGQLLAGKLLVAAAMLVVWPALLSLPWWSACGFSPAEIVGAAGNLFVIQGVVVLVGVAAAAATDSYPRYLLWTCLSVGVLTSVLNLTEFLRDPVYWAPPALGALAQLGAFLPQAKLGLLLAVLLALQIIGNRFFVRHYRQSLVIGLAVTLFAGAGVVTVPRVALWQRTAGPVVPADDAIRLTVAGPMRVEDLQQTRAAVLAVPVRFDYLSDGTFGFFRQIDGTWKSGEKIWSKRGGYSFGQSLPRVARQLLRLPPAPPASPVITAKFFFGDRGKEMMTEAQRIAAEASSFQSVVTLYLADGRLRAEVPLPELIARARAGVVSLARFEQRRDLVTFTVTLRSPLSEGLQSFAAGLDYIALINRRTGELIEPAVSTRAAAGRTLLNGVLVTMVPMAFKIPSAPGWLDEARLVVIGFERGRTVVRKIASDPLTVTRAE